MRWSTFAVEQMYVGLFVIALIGFLITFVLNELDGGDHSVEGRLSIRQDSRRADEHPQPRLQSARSPGVAQELAPFVEVHGEQPLGRQRAHQPEA